ncbi:MAG: alpha-1,4-glucan--maltose-1-phosphate maltosyltransferase [Bacteroidia bacterium]
MQAQSRVVIENVRPNLENGRYYSKGVFNDPFTVTADIFADGHDVLNAHLLYKQATKRKWHEVPFTEQGNDAWEATFILDARDYFDYKVEAWVDHALTWHYGLTKKVKADVDVKVELGDGLPHLSFLMNQKLSKDQKTYVSNCIELINSKSFDEASKALVEGDIEKIFREFPEKPFKSEYDAGLQVYADREKAVFSTWYEFFPRSSSSTLDKQGTFKACEAILPYVQELGFDTLYFPPIHPIGFLNRKGKNNTTTALPGDVGSPWAIGAPEGGHKDILPDLGTLEDFKSLITKAKELGIDMAMDFALQATPEHPYIKEHPSWFKWRSDGTIQYAENPPKKYQDINPIYFETEDHKAMWEEFIGIAKYWVDQGIKVFRVDNPHTKPFHFWKELISEVKKYDNDVIFLAEAFSRPRIMEGLGKAGFTQSYSYFTWRNSKHEFIEYLTELTKTERKNYMRPNFWPNTPDINPYHLQGASDTKHLIRLFLAATLSSNYGIYGPVFEQMISDALPGREEYLYSEKFEQKVYDWSKRNRVTAHISLINRLRKENKALQRTDNIQFCHIENDNILAYLKADKQSDNYLLCVVSLDEHNTQSGWVQLPLHEIGIAHDEQYNVHDLISNDSYIWNGEWNYVQLHLPAIPYHLFKIKKIK